MALHYSDVSDGSVLISDSSFEQILPIETNDIQIQDLSSDDEDLVHPNDNSNENTDQEIVFNNWVDIRPDDNSEDVNNSGLHTDDSLNTLDSEGRVLVNVGHPPKDPDIYLAPQIARRIKRHQIGGIRFLYDSVVKKSSGFGCILSHSMGLGKTMQIISFVDVFLSYTNAKHVLCIVPVNTLKNWITEFEMWTPEKGGIDQSFRNCEEVKYRTFQLFDVNEAKYVTERAKIILKWRKSGGVLLIGYEMFRILTTINDKTPKKNRKIDPKLLKSIYIEIRRTLINVSDLVVCDEGHRIKNCDAAISQALKRIRTKRRIILTGYPLQNNLMEYWCMIDFVRPNYLGQMAQFIAEFDLPITSGQCIDSTPNQIQIMKYRAHVLYQLLKRFVQRRNHSVLKNVLPLKYEYVLMCRMTSIQKDLMIAFLDTAINDPGSLGTRDGRVSSFLIFAVCFKVWNHPDIVFDMIRKNDSSDESDIESPIKKKTKIKSNPKKKDKSEPTNDIQSKINETINSLNDIQNDLFDIPLRQKYDGVLNWTWAENTLVDYIPGIIENSFKMILLFDIIDECLSIGDRLLIFSQSLLTLDMIERFLQSRNIPKTTTKWEKYQSYYRLDGSTPTHERNRFINLFNNTNSAHLFLISTRAGGLGINLIGANRIVVLDNSWNPCHEAQAVCRIYRYGQSKPCYIYRLVCDNSLEKKIYDRQVNKQGMANRVVDEQNPESHFTWDELFPSQTLKHLLYDLHTIEEPPVEDFNDEQLSIFNDSLIKKICLNNNHCITRLPFEHESLFLDQIEEKLSSPEKQMAFDDYEECTQRMNVMTMSQDFNDPIPHSSNGGTSKMSPNSSYLLNMSSNSHISQTLPTYPPKPKGVISRSPYSEAGVQSKRTVSSVTSISDPNHSRTSSTESHPPEVIELSDDDDSPEAFNISTSSEASIGNGFHNGIDSSITKRETNRKAYNSETETSERSQDFSSQMAPMLTKIWTHLWPRHQ